MVSIQALRQSVPADDQLWAAIKAEVKQQAEAEPILASFLQAVILNHRRLEDALSFHLAGKLQTPVLPAMSVRELIDEAFASDAAIGEAVRADIRAVAERDPASSGFSQVVLYFKGFHSLQTHRVAHWLWKQNRQALAQYLQSRTSEAFGVDIHPAARIGKGILIDHATGVVIGETAVVEDDVSMLHEVTLGGTGKERGDRHPKVRRGVLIGAGAKILGNVEIGQCAKVGAGSVVLEDVPAHSTVVGVPARVVGCPNEALPAHEMNHRVPCGNTGTNS